LEWTLLGWESCGTLSHSDMPDQKSDVRAALPSRQILLASDKEELVGIIEALQIDLQRRMDVEEEILHASLQKGTASLQSQVEEASRRFKIAQQELDAFRLEILRDEGDPAGLAPRPYIYEDLTAPPQEGPDRSTLRSLLTSFRRLRDERDRLKSEVEQKKSEPAEKIVEKVVETVEVDKSAPLVAELEATQKRLQQELDEALAEAERIRAEKTKEVFVPPTAPDDRGPAPAPVADRSEEVAALRSEVAGLENERDQLEQFHRNARAEIEKLYGEIEEARDTQSRALNEAGQLRSVKAGLEGEVERVTKENEGLQEESARHVQETADLSRKLAYEQAKSDQLGIEQRGLVARLAETGRKLEEARFELENPQQTVGFEALEKFLQKSRLQALLEKHVRGDAAGMVYEFIGAVIGAQDNPLEAARNLTPRIHRPQRDPGLGELRRFIEGMKDAELDGAMKVHDALRFAFFSIGKRAEPVTVDLDSLELVVDQRPNPAQSYWPLVLYVQELQEFWHGALRMAPDDSPKAIAAFLAEGLSRMPSSLDKSRVRLRADARFHGDAVLKLLESKKCSYVIAAPDTAEVRAAARACPFAALADGWEAGEWITKGRSSSAPQVRTVALRHVRASRPGPEVPFTFRDPQHVYHAFAVDRKISAAETLACYAARETAEEREHALLRDFCVNRMKARGPEAHATFLPLFLLAADLLQWYRRSVK
jgi:hypothetical protein